MVILSNVKNSDVLPEFQAFLLDTQGRFTYFCKSVDMSYPFILRAVRCRLQKEKMHILSSIYFIPFGKHS